MSEMRAQVTEGRLIIPREIQVTLGIQDGGTLALVQVAKGVVLLQNTSLSRPQIAEAVLRNLVISVGQEAERAGIDDEEHLAPILRALRRQSYETRYGRRETA
jgi:bifunctional DNA-binding transcriptional regulator/antitoxin component of YhaV-PrlF toxin-antitoxin module